MAITHKDRNDKNTTVIKITLKGSLKASSVF